MVRITVITPVFNGKRYIEKCLRNVADQDCPFVEHLIMDGASTDGTAELVAEWAHRYPHIRLVSEKDKGQSNAMNKGIHLAKGSIISFLNVDDYYEPNTLNRALEVFKDLPEPSFVCGNLNVWHADGTLRHFNKPSRLSLVELVSHKFEWPYNPSAYFYHKSIHDLVGMYNEEEHFVMDYDFILRVARQIPIRYVDETWGNFCVVEESKTLNNLNTNFEGARLAGIRLREQAKTWLTNDELQELERLLSVPETPSPTPKQSILKRILTRFTS